MVLRFCGNQPAQKFINIGVTGNNKVDELVLILPKVQGKINLADFRPYLKIANKDFSFVDKTQDFTFDTAQDDVVVITATLADKVTRQRNVDMQLSFEKSETDDTVVWQSQIFNVSFDPSLDINGEIAKEYPDVLQDLERRVESALQMTVCIDRKHFPEAGAPNVVYVDASNGMQYIYNTVKKSYEIIGFNPDDIKIINANGGV